MAWNTHIPVPRPPAPRHCRSTNARVCARKLGRARSADVIAPGREVPRAHLDAAQFLRHFNRRQAFVHRMLDRDSDALTEQLADGSPGGRSETQRLPGNGVGVQVQLQRNRLPQFYPPKPAPGAPSGLIGELEAATREMDAARQVARVRRVQQAQHPKRKLIEVRNSGLHGPARCVRAAHTCRRRPSTSTAGETTRMAATVSPNLA